MAHFICEQCGDGFKRCKNGGRAPIRFCSQPCYRLWKKENGVKPGFSKGHKTWNKGIKGRHFSPETEFKKGIVPKNKCKVGTVRIRTRKRDGQQRAWVKVAEPNTWKLRAVVEWVKAYGPIPKGLIVHHEDRDTLNDSLNNLSLMTRAAHLLEHRHEFEEKRLERLVSPRRRSR